MKTTDPISAEKPKLLITGAGGFLGGALCRLAVERWSVFGNIFRNDLHIPGVTAVQTDLTDEAALVDMIATIQPHAVVHAAAASQVINCESHPERTRAINVRVTERLAQLCAERGMAYVFTSTDLVFDGRQAPYSEDDRANPICEYARQKAIAETAVLNCHPHALVCRLPLMFGLPRNADRHFTSQMLDAILVGRPLALFVDEYRTPVDITSAAAGILSLMGRTNGLLHLGGRTRVSRYDLGCMMAQFLKKPPTMLKPVSKDDHHLPVARVADCSLVSERAYGLGYAPQPLKTAIEAVVHQFLQTRCNR